MRTWVLHWCDDGQWKVENWIYTEHDAAMHWAENYMEHGADAAVIEDITNMNPHKIVGFLRDDIRAWPAWTTGDPWNFRYTNYFKGVRVRERHRKKYKTE